MEKFPAFQRALDGYSHWECRLDTRRARVFVHYLIIHHLNLDRLKQYREIKVPRARFVFLRSTRYRRRFVFFGAETVERNLVPGIVQEAVEGIQLWDMYDRAIQGIRPDWHEHMPAIANKLGSIVSSDDFDWNPKNFVYTPEDRNLYYIDSKPTTFSAKAVNDQNLEGIERFFVNWR